MTTRTRPPKLVRYVSPFDSPASMPVERAEQLLETDLKAWAEMDEAGMLDERMRRIGKPRIGDDSFHLSDLPEWVEIDLDDRFETVRMLVRRAEHWAKNLGGRYVVIERDGKMAAVKRALALDDDLIVWETAR